MMKEFVQYAKKYNMNVKMTKDTHQTGSDRVAEVAEHTDGDLYINIQGDEPVINPEMIREVISILQKMNRFILAV